jgi:hypothetical protein
MTIKPSGRRVRTGLLAGAGTLALSFAMAPSASASADYWDCTAAPLTAGQWYCYGDRHSLTASYARSYGGSPFDVYVGAASSVSPVTIYASLVYGSGYRCHSYSGQNVLYPIVYNPYTYRRPYQLFSQWGSGGLTCDQLSPVRFAPADRSSKGQRTKYVTASGKNVVRIATRNGAGGISRAADRVCMTVPDPQDGYGVGCASPTDVKRDGLIVGLTGQSSGSITAILPEGGSATVTRASGRDTTSKSVATGQGGTVSVTVEPGDSLNVSGPSGSRSVVAPGPAILTAKASPGSASPFTGLELRR